MECSPSQETKTASISVNGFPGMSFRCANLPDMHTWTGKHSVHPGRLLHCMHSMHACACWQRVVPYQLTACSTLLSPLGSIRSHVRTTAGVALAVPEGESSSRCVTEAKPIPGAWDIYQASAPRRFVDCFFLACCCSSVPSSGTNRAWSSSSLDLLSSASSLIRLSSVAMSVMARAISAN